MTDDANATPPRSRRARSGTASSGATPAVARPRAGRRTRSAPPDPAARPPAPSRPPGLRLARVHLRMGSLGLARAELEAFAGRDELDEDALLDLAEARWRTGDLAGAGEAADALLAMGREDAVALVIAAEAAAALDQPAEARRLAGRAMAAMDGPLDGWFAGMPRSLIWPDDGPGPVPASSTAGRPASAGHDAARTQDGTAVGPAPEGRVTAASEAFAAGRAALAAGDAGSAALRLGVALRLDAGFAQDVLDAVGAAHDEPALTLVAGDALRMLGREADALAAFDRAHRTMTGPAGGSPDAPGVAG